MRRLSPHEFAEIFGSHYPRLFRYLNRLSGDPDLAADIAQETFVKLWQRGGLPEEPAAWLVTVASNAFRNATATRERRGQLLQIVPEAERYADHAVLPDAGAAAGERARRVRAALNAMPERDRQLLLLRAEGYRYRDIAAALELNESSVGTLLARAKSAFRNHYEGRTDAPD
jgi:RNA polymerase sigma factor (sigma-70 family)